MNDEIVITLSIDEWYAILFHLSCLEKREEDKITKEFLSHINEKITGQIIGDPTKGNAI